MPLVQDEKKLDVKPDVKPETENKAGATLNGKTPEEIAHEIVNPEAQMLEMEGYVYENLVKITKYMHKDDLAVKSEHFWEKQKESLIAATLKELINTKAKQLEKYMDKRAELKTIEYFKFLRAKGMSVEQACEVSGYKL